LVGALCWWCGVAGGGTSVAKLEIDLSRPDAAKDWHFEDASWRVKEGVLEQTDPRLHGTMAILPARAFSRVTCEGEFMALPAGKGVKAASLIFASTDSENYYWTHFDCRNRQHIMCVRHNGQYKELGRAHGLDMPLGKWHQMKVVHEPPKIEVYLNGKVVASVTDATHKAGVIGVRCGQGHIRFRNLRAQGTTVALATPWREKAPAYQIVCEDAGAGSYEAFPDIVKLRNGDLLCVFYSGYSHVALPNERLPKGGLIAACRSTDNGKTWGKPTVVADTPLDDRDPSICQLRNGTVICNFFRSQYTYENKRRKKLPGFERSTDTFIVRSADNGQTWEQKPQLIPSPFDESNPCSEPIRELADGTLILPTYGRNTGKPYAAAIIRSTDGGKTWGDATIIQDDHNHYEPSVIQLPDKSLLCTLRPCMCITRSTDLGRTWTPRKRMGIRGDASYLLRTSKGIILNAHRHPGTSVEYSLDDGRTWSKPVQIDTAGGAYPSMVELDDGTILCVYYNDRGRKGHGIRARRFRADREGIHFVETQPK